MQIFELSHGICPFWWNI